MPQFFVNRPIVAMVIAIITVIIGLVSMARLPVAQYPNIVPPQIQVNATYVGADALTVEQSVATPIEQQVNGVEGMEYMYSVNANNGSMTLNVFFGVDTVPTDDQILTQMRQAQANSQLPSPVVEYGTTVQQSTSAPLLLFALSSPDDTFNSLFLANYAYINLNNELARLPGISNVAIFGAGQYAMRIWVTPDQLAKLDVTAQEIINAVKQQNRVNPVGKVGAKPIPSGQEFAYTVIGEGYLTTVEEFGEVVVRANADGSILRLKDVARIELGAQNYNVEGRFQGKQAAIIALYQTPGSNALDAAASAQKLMKDLSQRFPPGMQYTESLNTTLAVTAGIEEIVKTLFEALLLVIIVVFIFLQGWRATLIPLLAVPVSLIGTFAIFPLLGFSINTLSLFGLVLAIGLVVDDAIVVVEAVEHHIEQGMSPRDATLKAMQEVSGPVVAIALVLSSVFIPTIFIPGITGSLYQQFAVTIAVSVCLSAFNALTLSPAIASLILRPKGESRGLLGGFYKWFNNMFANATNKYVRICSAAIRKLILSLGFLGLLTVAALFFGGRLAPSFLPEEDQGYFYAALQLPNASSMERTGAVAAQVEKILMETPGVEYVTTAVGFNLLSQVYTTYNAFFFVTLKPWGERTSPQTQYNNIMRRVNAQLAVLPSAMAFAFSPPAIPGVGTSGGVNFILQDRSGGTVEFLAEQTQAFMAAASKRPELERLNTTFLPPFRSSNCPSTATKPSSRAWRSTMPTIRCALSSAERWSIISTASGCNGRSTCRPRANTAQSSTKWGNSTCATATARACPFPASCKASRATDRNSPCASTCIVRRRSTPTRPKATARRRPWPPWRRSSPRPCRRKWASITSACPSRRNRPPKAFRPWPSSPSRSSSSSSSSPRNTKAGRCPSVSSSARPSPSSALSSPCGRAAWRTMSMRRSVSSCSSAWPPRTPSSSSNSANRNMRVAKIFSTPRWRERACVCVRF